jgi:hypothetical protein
VDVPDPHFGVDRMLSGNRRLVRSLRPAHRGTLAIIRPF